LILSFGDPTTEDLYHGRATKRVQRFPTDIAPAALRKLDMLAASHALTDLRSPPGNRLEALKGGWKGYRSIRINDRWRVVFRWERNTATQVTIFNYH
jgi:proteic killer suppression protein